MSEPLTLPTGYQIITHPKTGVRFVMNLERQLIPYQVARKPGEQRTDEQIISDFYIWYNRQPK